MTGTIVKPSNHNPVLQFALWLAAFVMGTLVACWPLRGQLDRLSYDGEVVDEMELALAQTAAEQAQAAPVQPISPDILQNCLELIPLEEYRKSDRTTSYWERQEMIHSGLEKQFGLAPGSLYAALEGYAQKVLNRHADGEGKRPLNPALAYFYLEDWAAAEVAAMEVYQGTTSRQTASEALELAAWSLWASGQSYRAQRILQQALGLRSPEGNFERWSMLQHLTAELQMRQQRHAEAEKGFGRLVKEHLRRKNYGAPGLHLAWQMVIQNQLQQGKGAAAIKHLQVQNRILEKLFGPEHSLAMANRKTLIQALSQEKRFAEALEIAEALLARQEAVIPEMENMLLLSRSQRAALLIHTGQAGRAAEELREILPRLERVFGRQSAQVLSARSKLAAAMAAENDLARAENLYRELIPLSETIAGPEDPLTLELLFDLARTLGRREDRGKEAGQLAMRVERLRQKHLGKNHPQTREAREFLQSLARKTP